MQIFIASPLFNPPQIAIIERIEQLITKHDHTFYSARQHSGSEKIAYEDRKKHRAWDQVYDSNERGLDAARACIAVLEYALPEDRELGLLRRLGSEEEYQTPNPRYFSSMDRAISLGGRGFGAPHEFTPLELPDAGTVFEIGYLRALRIPVVGFHSTKCAQHLNLMLSHGCAGLISGWERLEQWLAGNVTPLSDGRDRTLKALMMRDYAFDDIKPFDWEACELWQQEIE